jgi:hypothetical protein
MSVLIRGMEMPKRGHTTTITIVGSGQAYVEYFDCRPHVKETIEYTAVSVPPHGRLIDADELANSITGAIYHSDLRDAPTILPAEEGE